MNTSKNIDLINQHDCDILYIELLKIIHNNNISRFQYKDLFLFKNTRLFDVIIPKFFPPIYPDREKLKKEIICKIFCINNIKNIDEVYDTLVLKEETVTKFISYYIDKKYTEQILSYFKFNYSTYHNTLNSYLQYYNLKTFLNCMLIKDDLIKYTKLILETFEKTDFKHYQYIQKFVKLLKYHIVYINLTKYDKDDIKSRIYNLKDGIACYKYSIDDFTNTAIFNFIECKIKYLNIKLYPHINHIKEIENEIILYLIYLYIGRFIHCVKTIFKININVSHFDNFIKIRKKILNNKKYESHDLHVFSILTRELEYVIKDLKNLPKYIQKDYLNFIQVIYE